MITRSEFGKTQDGTSVIMYSISNSKGMQADFINYGAIMVNLFVPDRNGIRADINLGYDRPEKYFTNPFFFGATVGPVANRTAGAKVVLNGVEYLLDKNEGENNLHSHFDEGFHKRCFETEVDEENNSIIFRLSMKDGELGLPGNRRFSVTYSVSEDNELIIKYKGTTDKKTIFNPTNHSYFNLAGHESGSVAEQTLWLNCTHYTEINSEAIPTGRIAPVEETPFDFTKPVPIGARIRSRYNQMHIVSGYDHNFVRNGNVGEIGKVAVLSDKSSGRTMEVYTDMPGIQVYTANNLVRHTGKGGVKYKRRCAIALETQFFPNSANEPNFARPLLVPEKPFRSVTIYKFVY